MLKRVLRQRWAQAIAAASVGRYLTWTMATTRWSLVGAEHLQPTLDGAPTIVAFWHERLMVITGLFLHATRSTGGRLLVHVLVSRHADGRLIGDVVAPLGVRLVYGSSRRRGEDRGGAEALRQLADILAAGGTVAITPDGPRGPRRIAAGGVARLAEQTGADVLPVAAQTRRRRVLRTWDRMVLGLPYSRGVLVCGPRLRIDDAAVDLPRIEAAMTEAADAADRLCP